MLAAFVAHLRADPMHLVYHCGTMLSLTGVFMKDILFLRLLTFTGSLCSMSFWFSRRPILWGPIFWGTLFGMANLNMIIRLVIERMAGRFVATEELELFERQFSKSGMTTRQFFSLMNLARRVSVPAGAHLRQEGTGPRSELMLLIEGEVAVLWGDDLQVKRVLDGGHAGGWLGEMSFLARFTNKGWQPASGHCVAELVSRTVCRVLVWTDADLEQLLNKDAELRRAFVLFLADIRFQRMLSRSRSDEYAAMLAKVLRDGALSSEDANIVNTFRLKHNLSPWEHEWHLNQLGWTLEEWMQRVVAKASEEQQQDLIARAVQRGPQAPRPGMIVFNDYSRDFSELGPYYPANFRDDDGAFWASVQHYLEAQKHPDPQLWKEIRDMPDPHALRSLTRKPRFTKTACANWDTLRDAVMLRATRWKFAQDARCAQVLRSTGDRELLFNSPMSDHWGSGDDGRGRNRLGEVLQQVREELRAATVSHRTQRRIWRPWRRWARRRSRKP